MRYCPGAEDGFAAKQIHAPEAVLGLCEDGQPGGIKGSGVAGAVVLRKRSAHDILVDLGAEQPGCSLD